MIPHQIMNGDYMAHGFCFNWEKPLVILHVASDIVTGISYYSIPIAMFYFIYRRRDLPFLKLFILFALFIFSCGTTHFLDAYTVYVPIYWVDGYVKAFTAIVSALTAVLFIPRIPEAIAYPSIVNTLKEVKKLNSELNIKNAALREQAELLNLAHDAIIVRDLRGKVVFWNRGAEDTYGWTKEEAMGRVTYELLQTRSPKPLAELGAEIAERGIWEGELIHLRKDRREILVASRWAVQRDESGLQVGVLEINRDVTERKRAEVALQKLNEELEMRVAQRTAELENSQAQLETRNKNIQEAHLKLEHESAERIRILEDLRHKEQLLFQQSRLVAMGEMLMSISHHWRQPLNVLAVKAQELGLSYRYGGFNEELLDSNIGEMMETIKHMSQTISDFQGFIAPDQGKMPFRADQVVAKAVGLVEENFKSQGIGIDLSSTGESQINGYPNEYGQVLLNLLTNARDAFLEHGATHARIVVRSWSENGRTLVTVTDNAGGINGEIIEKIFDAYFTTKELGKGTGVGLFLSKNIIEKNMGGRLSVRNVNGGAEFKIEV